jgi:hypothetical protein
MRSSHTPAIGEGLESPRGGAEQFRRCRQIPVGVLRLQVAEVDGKLRYACTHIDANFTGEANERAIHDAVVEDGGALGHEERFALAVVVEGPSLLRIGVERLGRSRMEWNEPRLAELCLDDTQPRRIRQQVDFIVAQSDGLANPEPKC